MNGISRIAAERQRQIEVEGFDKNHDAQHIGGELAWAATHYAMPEHIELDHSGIVAHIYPELFAVRASRGRNSIKFSHTGVRIRQLEIAGALIAAEIDRLLALEGKNHE